MININDIEFYESIIWCRLGHIDIDLRVPLYIKNNRVHCIILDTNDNNFGKLITSNIEYINKLFQVL